MRNGQNELKRSRMDIKLIYQQPEVVSNEFCFYCNEKGVLFIVNVKCCDLNGNEISGFPMIEMNKKPVSQLLLTLNREKNSKL